MMDSPDSRSDGGTVVIERVSGDRYVTTGEYRVPRPGDDFLDPATGNIYGGGMEGRKQIIVSYMKVADILTPDPKP